MSHRLLQTLLAAVPTSLMVASSAYAQDEKVQVLDVGLGESTIQRESRALARVLISDPEIAELRLLEEGQFQVRGLAVGSTDLWVWYRDDIQHPRSFRVVVNADLTDIKRRIAATVKGPSPNVYPLKDHIVVDGPVADLETLERVASVARVYDEDFINLLSVRGDHQVQLRVVFAEINRTGLRELGLNVFVNPPGFLGSMIGPGESGASTTRYRDSAPTVVPNINEGIIGSPASGVFNLTGFLYGGGFDVSAILSVLEENAIARTLAQPTLTALSGQQAEFLSGGEIPIPVSQQQNQITIEYKEYGIKLIFVPTVLSGDVIDMRAYVEVSEIDPVNSTRLSGVEIPAISTRKGSSHLRLESGMTFALAGLLNERVTSSRAQIPILGDIPILGAAFRYVRHERSETELVIFVTPELVRPMAANEVPPPPGTTQDYNPSDFELFMLGTLVVPGTRTAEPTGAYGLER